MKWKVQEVRKGEREGKDKETKYKTVGERERRERRLGGKVRDNRKEGREGEEERTRRKE